MAYILPKNLNEKAYYFKVTERYSEEEPDYNIDKVYIQSKSLYKNNMLKELLLHNNGITKSLSSIGLLGCYFFNTIEDAQEFIRKQKIEYHRIQIAYHKGRIQELT